MMIFYPERISLYFRRCSILGSNVILTSKEIEQYSTGNNAGTDAGNHSYNHKAPQPDWMTIEGRRSESPGVRTASMFYMCPSK